MSNFNWLSHGGPGSGRYELGSGIRPYQHRGWGLISSRKKKKKYDDIKFKKPKPRLGEGTVTPNSWEYPNKKSRKKSKKDPDIIDVEFEDREDYTKNKKRSKKDDKQSIKTESKTSSEEEKDEEKDEEKEYKNSDKLKDASSQFRTAAKATDSISSGFDKAYNHLHSIKNEKGDRSKEVESLSNEELRRVIERIKLNEEYNKVTAKKKSKGYHRTMAALALLGSAATVTATGLSIASGIKKLRND